MTPPENSAAAQSEASGSLPAVLPCVLTTLAIRADFLRAAQARRQTTQGFLLQARLRSAAEPATGIRIGYTCSKKVGNAIARNRAKRRLREIARAVLPAEGRSGWDYVLVGRPEITATRPFAQLLADLSRALSALHPAP